MTTKQQKQHQRRPWHPRKGEKKSEKHWMNCTRLSWMQGNFIELYI